MTIQQLAQPGISYLDMQAYVGITKHNGGFAATNELLSLCHIAAAREVLDVGCGIGVGPTYIAQKHLFRLYVMNPGVRPSLREMFSAPSAVMENIGYGLFVGRK